MNSVSKMVGGRGGNTECKKKNLCLFCISLSVQHAHTEIQWFRTCEMTYRCHCKTNKIQNINYNHVFIIHKYSKGPNSMSIQKVQSGYSPFFFVSLTKYKICLFCASHLLFVTVVNTHRGNRIVISTPLGSGQDKWACYGAPWMTTKPHFHTTLRALWFE